MNDLLVYDAGRYRLPGSQYITKNDVKGNPLLRTSQTSCGSRKASRKGSRAGSRRHSRQNSARNSRTSLRSGMGSRKGSARKLNHSRLSKNKNGPGRSRSHSRASSRAGSRLGSRSSLREAYGHQKFDAAKLATRGGKSRSRSRASSSRRLKGLYEKKVAPGNALNSNSQSRVRISGPKGSGKKIVGGSGRKRSVGKLGRSRSKQKFRLKTISSKQ